MQDLSIQIVNYKTKKYLSALLLDLIKDLKSSKLTWEAHILDNNSGDDLSDLEKEYERQNVFFHYSNKNLGFGGGHNLLSKESKSKYILILNPDIKFLEAKTIDRLFSKIKSSGKAKVVGPRLLTEKGKTQEWDHGELSGLLAKIALRCGNSYWKNQERTAKAAWVSGAVFLIERSVFDQSGNFDEKFFLYKEEEDLCLRIRNSGFDILYTPDISMTHIGSVVAKKSEHMQKSVDYFLEKHFKNKPGYSFFRILNKIVN